MLKIYNSLTGKKEIFKPLTPGKIGIYVCGNTVYDYCHIGHARSMIVFDVVVRYLRNQNFEVIYVRNITDIDDKIIKRALENNESIDDLTRRFIDAQHEDEKSLGLLAPDHEPRATQYIPQMCDLIQKLRDQGYAYIAGDNDICFEVRRFSDYGQLSGRDIEKLKAGTRKEFGDSKRDPLDFVLWKISKPGEPHWPSQWGDGRPGWHIECSAMSTDLLGQPFDIHGGGMDLKFPHHENEIAQSEAACGRKFAQLWMHAGLLQINGEKMSKSLGNFLTVRDALSQYHPEELRLFMLNTHYSKPADFSQRNLYESKRRLFRFYHSIEQLPSASDNKIDAEAWQEFTEAMDDDFNTSIALNILGDSITKANKALGDADIEKAGVYVNTAKKIAAILGILQDPHYLKGRQSEEDKIESLIDEREIYRAQKNWSKADEVRRKLTEMGIIIEDGVVGTRWRRLIK